MTILTILTILIILITILIIINKNQEEDELEFSVCLPSPTLEPSASLTDDRTEPVVFILGFEVLVHRYHHYLCLLDSWL